MTVQMDSDLIYGKDKTKNIVSIEQDGDTCFIFAENEAGVELIKVPSEYWTLSSFPDDQSIRLKGNLALSYANKFKTKSELSNHYRMQQGPRFKARDYASMYMLKTGATYFKETNPENVSVLSFDIETTGLVQDENSKVLIISNTYKKNNIISKKVFRFDEYETDKEMIKAWCRWVRKIDPSIITGHNILSYDLPYMAFCNEGPLKLGRDGSSAKFAFRTSLFRKDQSQSYEYKNINIFGREVVDTMFLSIKHDAATKKYDSYGLKSIIKQEGLEREDRQHYDAATIKDNYTNKEEFNKIVEYAKDDADDALALYEMMIPAIFQYCKSVPMSLQSIVNSATGSQINAFVCRAYIQNKHSIPNADEVPQYEGGISIGNPGLYKHVYKVDVASLYPSIILQYLNEETHKDPLSVVYKMVKYFTEERLVNKQKAIDTGESYYKSLEQAQKIFINSAYGFLGARGQNFNNPQMAAAITRHGREILNKAIAWAEEKGYSIVNADTDSISYTKGSKLEDFNSDIIDLNMRYDELIRWEDDGYYKKVLIVKAKNYVLDTGKERIIKGSALKATTKERSLQELISKTIDLLLKERKDLIYDSYHDCVNSIYDINSVDGIRKWSSKKTITSKVLNPQRTNEQVVLDAIRGKTVQEGDKIRVFYRNEKELSLVEDFDGTFSKKRLLTKVHKTMTVFKTLIDVDMLPDYGKKRNMERINK